MRQLGWIALLLGVLATNAAGQAVRAAGDAAGPEVELLRSILNDGRYLLLRRDTVLPADWRHDGDVVVLDAEVRLEGEIRGRVAVVSGGLFVRPRAVIIGPVVVADGGFYPSGLATTGPVLQVPAEVRVERSVADGGAVVSLLAPPPPPRISYPGIFGIGIPTYDRVNGATLRASARLRLGAAREGARATGTVLYHTARGELGGIASVEAPLTGSWWGMAELARRAATNEEWIRGDLTNSLAALFLGSDLRNYHEVDEAILRLQRRLPQPLIQGEGWFGPWAGVRVEQARSLDARDPWALFGGDWRDNPPVLPGTIGSVEAGAELTWRGATLSAQADVAGEWALEALGDFAFSRIVVDAAAQMQALRNHRLQVRTHLLVPLGGTAPPQRWSFVGGSNTLPTLPVGALRGDHLVFVESTYAIPLPAVQLPVLGAPELRLEQATGSAWVGGDESPGWEQNLGVGFGFSLAEVMIYANPAEEAFSPTLNVGFTLPF